MLPFGIQINQPFYHNYLTHREVGNKTTKEQHNVEAGEKWYLIMSQVYIVASKYTLMWYEKTYSPSKEEIKILIRCERFLQLEPKPTDIKQTVKLGYKDVMLFCLQKQVDELEDKIAKLTEEYGDRFGTSRQIVDLLNVNIATVEQI